MLSDRMFALIADLRLMHMKVTEVHTAVTELFSRYSEAEVCRYADDINLLRTDIDKVDAVYRYFVNLDEKLHRAEAAARMARERTT